MLQTWAQDDKKTARIHPNAEDLSNMYFCQTSDLGLRLEVDFVFPLSQEQEEEEQQPHQNLPDRIELRVWNLAHRLKLTRLRSKVFSLGRPGV